MGSIVWDLQKHMGNLESDKMSRWVMKLLMISVLLPCMVVWGCATADTEPDMADDDVPGEVQVFQVRGVVQGVQSDGAMIMVAHEEIPGYMMAMTMPFFVKNPVEVLGIEKGQKIQFELVIDGNNAAIRNVRRLER